jgi:hypothetical protein
MGMLPSPGICRTCGSNQRACVDFGVTFDYEGAVLFCVQCLQQLRFIDELGFIDRSTVDGVIQANMDLMLKDTALDLLRKELRDGVVAVLDRYDTAVTDSIRDLLPVPADTPVESAKLF